MRDIRCFRSSDDTTFETHYFSNQFFELRILRLVCPSQYYLELPGSFFKIF